MKIQVNGSGPNISIALTAENEAEIHQLDHTGKQAQGCKADAWFKDPHLEGRTLILRVEEKK